MTELCFRLVQISDTHISKYGQFVESMFDKAVEEINQLEPKPEAVIHCGDLTDNGILVDYEFALEKLKNFKSRIIVAPGNHDERNYGQSLFREVVSSMDFEVKSDNMVIIVLNSPEPDRDEGRLGRRRQSYLENRLKAVPEDTTKVVVFHHHLVPVPFSGRETNVLEDAGDVLELILKYGVDLVLMGHRHVGRALRIDNAVLVNIGTLSSIRTRGRLGHSFNIIDVSTNGNVRIVERNLTEGKNLLKLNCNIKEDTSRTIK